MRLFAKRTVVVNTKTGRSFRGVLWRRRLRYVLLKNAELIEATGVMSVDGEVVVDRSNIDFMQFVTAVAQ